jgi:Flp pilus assembly protein TadG
LLHDHALARQPASRRYKSGPSAIEFAFGATLICILAFSAVHAMGFIR